MQKYISGGILGIFFVKIAGGVQRRFFVRIPGEISAIISRAITGELFWSISGGSSGDIAAIILQQSLEISRERNLGEIPRGKSLQINLCKFDEELLENFQNVQAPCNPCM